MPIRDASRPSWETSVDRFYEPLYRFALSLSGSESVADALTLETYAHLGRLSESFREKSQVKTWLFTALYREFLARQRDSSKFRRQDFEPVVRDLPPAGCPTPACLNGDFVMRALQRVDEVFRAPVTLSTFRN